MPTNDELNLKLANVKRVAVEGITSDIDKMKAIRSLLGHIASYVSSLSSDAKDPGQHLPALVGQLETLADTVALYQSSLNRRADRLRDYE